MGEAAEQEKLVMRMVEEVKPLDEQEKEKFLGKEMAVLDFDMLCSSVALQTNQGKWRLGNEEEEEGMDFGGGVLRMWEGELLDCFDDRRIALESTCCPCYRFGKNMQRAGFGSCFLQGTVVFILSLGALLNFIAFAITRRHCFLFLAVAFIINVGLYLGFFRIRMMKKFNIKGSDTYLDDCIFHFICPCCTLCQESRTLEINNVQNGTWHGRGDTMCIGRSNEENKARFDLCPPQVISMQTTDP